MLSLKRDMVRFLRGFNAVGDFALLQDALGYSFEVGLQGDEIVQPIVAWTVRLEGGEFVAMRRRSMEDDTHPTRTSLVIGATPLQVSADRMNADPNSEMMRVAQNTLLNMFRLDGLTEIGSVRLGVITDKTEKFRRLGFLHECYLPKPPELKRLQSNPSKQEVVTLSAAELLEPPDYDSWSTILATFVSERQVT